jgi:hypothetical protein
VKNDKTSFLVPLLQPTPVISSSYINEFEFFLISLSPVIVVSLNFLVGRGFLLSLLGL